MLNIFYSIKKSPEILIPIGGFIVGIFIFIAGLKWFSYKRLIENIPTSNIRAIAMGLVEIIGKVIPIENNILSSPFSNTECVYYKYSVERWVKQNDNHHWQVVNSGNSTIPFLVNDETGSVLVNPIGANIDIKYTTFISDSGHDPPLIIKDFISTQNLNYEGFFGINYKMRYREAVIIPNEKLYIIGTANDNPFKLDGSAQHSVEDIMIHKGKGKIYHISQKPETKVVRGYLIKALAGLIFGGLILVICFNVLLRMIQNF